MRQFHAEEREKLKRKEQESKDQKQGDIDNQHQEWKEKENQEPLSTSSMLLRYVTRFVFEIVSHSAPQEKFQMLSWIPYLKSNYQGRIEVSISDFFFNKIFFAIFIFIIVNIIYRIVYG